MLWFAVSRWAGWAPGIMLFGCLAEIINHPANKTMNISAGFPVQNTSTIICYLRFCSWQKALLLFAIFVTHLYRRRHVTSDPRRWAWHGGLGLPLFAWAQYRAMERGFCSTVRLSAPHVLFSLGPYRGRDTQVLESATTSPWISASPPRIHKTPI